jgi:hypothetical protein
MNLGETGKNLSFLVIIPSIVIAYNHKIKIVNSIYIILGSMH